MSDELEIYDSITLPKTLAIPKRSRLYPLKPIGIGTPYVESLTSYVTRLAQAHCVETGVLMEREIAPVIGKRYGGANLHKIYNFTKALNGTGVMASDLAEALAYLTFQDELHFLTMSCWSDVFPSRNLLRPMRAWCPVCYEQWYFQNQTVYEPLIWSLKVINICLHHKTKLTQICPHCHQENLPLAWQSRPGYCSKCHEWLGIKINSSLEDTKILKNQELEWKTWVCESVGELLSAAKSLGCEVSKQIIAQSLSKYVNLVYGGNIAACARCLNVPKNTLWLWCKGKNTPTLESLLKICFHLNLSLVDFLVGKNIEDHQTNKLPVNICQRQPRATAQEFDKDKVKSFLETTLKNSELPAIPMEEVARQLKVDRRTIFRNFPNLCRSISAKYLQYNKEAFSSEIQRCCQEVEAIVLKLHEQNIYPSESRVCEYISKPGHFRYQEVRDTLKQARKRLRL